MRRQPRVFLLALQSLGLSLQLDQHITALDLPAQGQVGREHAPVHWSLKGMHGTRHFQPGHVRNGIHRQAAPGASGP